MEKGKVDYLDVEMMKEVILCGSFCVHVCFFGIIYYAKIQARTTS